MDCGIPSATTAARSTTSFRTGTTSSSAAPGSRPSMCCTRPTTSPISPAASAPAPCEAACTLGINAEPVGHQVHRALHHRQRLGKRMGRAAAAQREDGQEGRRRRVRVLLAWLPPSNLFGPAGEVTVFEKNDRIGGLLTYGIPDFKLERPSSIVASPRWRQKASLSGPRPSSVART